MTTNAREATAVIHALREFRDRIDELLKRLDVETEWPPAEVAELQKLFRSLKTDVEKAARYGTVSGVRAERNEYEENFFQPAVVAAKAHSTTPANSSPLESNWIGPLEYIRDDFTHMLDQLERQFPDV